jgi:hypothetical protein
VNLSKFIFCDEAQEAAQRMTLAYRVDRLGMGEYAMPRFAKK